MAQTIQDELRDAACVARYGGEEFGVLMLASVEDTAAALDRLRDRLSKLEIQHEGKSIPVTLSAGTSQIVPDEKIGKLVRRSDEALYAAKAGGETEFTCMTGELVFWSPSMLAERLHRLEMKWKPRNCRRLRAACSSDCGG